MSDKSKLVWTSDPEAAKRLRAERTVPQDVPPGKQRIRVTVDRKRRAGKTVTVASGFEHSETVLAELATNLKKRCGAGGSAKGNEIEIQGNHVTTVVAELQKAGYKTST
jgi:translation initiation factor 1